MVQHGTSFMQLLLTFVHCTSQPASPTAICFLAVLKNLPNTFIFKSMPYKWKILNDWLVLWTLLLLNSFGIWVYIWTLSHMQITDADYITHFCFVCTFKLFPNFVLTPHSRQLSWSFCLLKKSEITDEMKWDGNHE